MAYPPLSFVFPSAMRKVLGQHRTIRGVRLKRPCVCIFSDIFHKNACKYSSVFPALFVSSGEKSGGASGHSELYGVVLDSFFL
jgi:hypothetical protein